MFAASYFQAFVLNTNNSWHELCNSPGIKTIRLKIMYINQAPLLTNLFVSNHAQRRMDMRGINQKTIDLVLKFGREVRTRGALFYVIGKKEIHQFYKQEPLLKDMEGIQVLTTKDGVIITTYRNKDLRQIRPDHRRLRHCH